MYGYAYTVLAGDIAELKEDAAYMRDYLRGVELLMLSWGWDLRGVTNVPNPGLQQCWHNWPIRLYKAGKSLTLFGRDREFASVRCYAQQLLSRGESFMYGGYDRSVLFR
jgi:hypothetical protein